MNLDMITYLQRVLMILFSLVPFFIFVFLDKCKKVDVLVNPFD